MVKGKKMIFSAVFPAAALALILSFNMAFAQTSGKQAGPGSANEPASMAEQLPPAPALPDVTPPTPGPGAPGGAETSAVRAEETADTAAALTDEENPDDAAVPSPRAAQAGQLNRERNQNMVGASETAEEGNKAAGAGEPKGQAKGRANAAAHRSAVASFVQSLNNIADREPGGIGEQVRAIAQEQNQAGEKVALAMEKVQNRNRFRTLLFGTDYKNAGAVRSEMVKTRNRIEKLNRIAADMEEGMDKTVLLEEAAALEAEQAKINEFIAANENKFSLFGWAVKLFAN